jgi:hypothetical protein
MPLEMVVGDMINQRMLLVPFCTLADGCMIGKTHPESHASGGFAQMLCTCITHRTRSDWG